MQRPAHLVDETRERQRAGVRGTAALLQTDVDLPMARAWLSMLVFFDVVFVTLALWTFAPVMSE